MAYSSDIAFTDAVKAVQTRKGARNIHREMEMNGSWPTTINPMLAEYITDMRSFFIATATANGQPYMQHRGGPAGFLKILDEQTLAFADFTGNQHFITQGNLSENNQAMLYLLDHLQRTRIKIWGTATIIEDDPALLSRLMPNPKEYSAQAEQILIFTVKAWDINCKQHIPQRIDAEDVGRVLHEKDQRIAELEKIIEQLKNQ